MNRRLTDTIADAEEIPLLAALTRDLKAAALLLTPSEARYLVDAYYQIQDARIRAAGQVRSANGTEPNSLLVLMKDTTETLENRVRSSLAIYAESKLIGKWLLAQFGIGPVLTAGLIAHIDIERATSPSDIWRLAGLDPTLEWNKGELRPWNARLKTLAWKCGESFVMFSGREECFYGAVYQQRKKYETERNEQGLYADQAAKMLEKFDFGKQTDARAHYTAGHLPPAHIHARAKRYAVKLLLSHMFECWHFAHYHAPGPKPYPLAHLDHIDYIAPPHMEVIPGLEEALERRKHQGD